MKDRRDPYENSVFYTFVSAGCAVLAYHYPPGALVDNLIKMLLWIISGMVFAAVNKKGIDELFTLFVKK